jgi:hypothetical protein
MLDRADTHPQTGGSAWSKPKKPKGNKAKDKFAIDKSITTAFQPHIFFHS